MASTRAQGRSKLPIKTDYPITGHESEAILASVTEDEKTRARKGWPEECLTNEDTEAVCRFLAFFRFVMKKGKPISLRTAAFHGCKFAIAGSKDLRLVRTDYQLVRLLIKPLLVSIKVLSAKGILTIGKESQIVGKDEAIETLFYALSKIRLPAGPNAFSAVVQDALLDEGLIGRLEQAGLIGVAPRVFVVCARLQALAGEGCSFPLATTSGSVFGVSNPTISAAIKRLIAEEAIKCVDDGFSVERGIARSYGLVMSPEAWLRKRGFN